VRGGPGPHHDVAVETNNFRIRRAGPEDAGTLAAIRVASWRAGYAGVVPDDTLAALDVGAEAERWTVILGDAATRGQRTVFVTDASGVVAGYACVGPYQQDETADRANAAPDDPDGELMACYLDPDWWGRGAGDPLIAAAASALVELGHHAAGLWVFEQNARARRFYERNGWEADGRVERRTPIGGRNVPRVRYRKNLTS
jgi:RimJ/RimL family protein N-acetyltransferase